MLTAFVRYADGQCEQCETVEAVAEAWQREGTAVWVDLEAPDEASLASIGGVFSLNAEALEDCLQGEQRPRVDDFADYIFLVLYGLLGADNSNGGFDPRKLAAFCGSRFLVTVHREPLLTLREVRGRCGRQAAQMLGRGVDYVLFTIIDGMVDKYGLVAEAYEKRLFALEDASLDPYVGETILSDLAELRHDLLELRQVAASQRELILPLAKGEYEYVSESLEPRFRHVHDHLMHVVEQVDVQRELLTAIRDNYHAALANRMNEAMRTLTVFATVMLPLTLLAGIYGMNVRLWPSEEEPWSFWAILGIMFGVGAALLIFFRRRKWV